MSEPEIIDLADEQFTVQSFINRLEYWGEMKSGRYFSNEHGSQSNTDIGRLLFDAVSVIVKLAMERDMALESIALNQGGKDDLPEIDITPEMIAAGREVLYRMTTDVADEDYWAAEIFKSMLAAARRNDL